MSRYLPHMTSKQVREALDRGTARVIIALGANEQHGPHGPFGTDTIVAEELSLRLADRVDALVAPVIPVGFSPQHLSWPGSLSLSQETLKAFIVEVGRQLVDSGFGELLFISGHGGNRAPMESAARELAVQLHDRAEVRVINLMAIQTSRHFRERVEALYDKPLSDVWEAHGGEQESAMVMARDPELVDLENAPSEPIAVEGYLRRTRSPEVFAIDYNLPKYSPAGNWGDPRGATAEQGRIILDALADYIAEKVNGTTRGEADR